MNFLSLDQPKSASPSTNTSSAHGGNLPNFGGPLEDLHENFTCYLKTRTSKFKEHTVKVRDAVIYFYRNVADKDARQTQTLSGSHIRLTKPQKVQINGQITKLYPVQADIPPDRTRIMYFDSEQKQLHCLKLLLVHQGFSHQLDQYKLVEKLGAGAFSQVLSAEHRETKERFAVKIIPFS